MDDNEGNFKLFAITYKLNQLFSRLDRFIIDHNLIPLQ